MTGTLAASLDVVLPHLGQPLASPVARERLRRLAALLPPIHSVLLECALAGPSDRVDLSQCVVPRGFERDLVARHLVRTIDLAPAHRRAAWQRIAAFHQQWLEPASPLHAAIPHMWWEFDLAAEDAQLPVPSVFLAGPRPPGSVPGLPLLELAGQAIATLHGQPPPPAAALCAMALPPGAQISHLGVMLSRPEPHVRINVGGLGLPGILHYLATIGWPGMGGPIPAALLPLGHLQLSWVLTFDVTDRVGPRIGLELFPATAAAVHALHAGLVQVGLAEPDKLHALEAWPGHDSAETSPVPWPEELALLAMAGGPQPDALVRSVNHLKLVILPHAVTQAKGYLYSAHSHLDRGPAWAGPLPDPRGSP